MSGCTILPDFRRRGRKSIRRFYHTEQGLCMRKKKKGKTKTDVEVEGKTQAIKKFNPSSCDFFFLFSLLFQLLVCIFSSSRSFRAKIFQDESRSVPTEKWKRISTSVAKHSTFCPSTFKCFLLYSKHFLRRTRDTQIFIAPFLRVDHRATIAAFIRRPTRQPDFRMRR